jgi:hypothetical protein
VRATFSCCLLGIACVGFAQTADVRIKLDATFSYRTESDGPTNLRLYGTDGRPSVLGLSFTLPDGFHGYVAEKLERITGDPDTSLLDQYYLEDPGLWRVGKQLIPFGLSRVVHETVLAARADTNLIFQGLPVSVLVCDAGKGQQEGVDTRIGSRVGVSLFLGEDFGISSASFTQIREPEASPGVGRGYQTAIAVDGSRRFGKFELKGEVINASQGETRLDPDMNVADGTVSYIPSRNVTLTAGYTWVSPAGQQFLRFGGSLPITRGIDFEPWIRFRDNALWDISLQIRIRL